MELPARAGTPGHKPGAAASESQAAAFKLCVVAARAGGPAESWGLARGCSFEAGLSGSGLGEASPTDTTGSTKTT
jgi:hypothetical protein